jgi:hypothetical protein
MRIPWRVFPTREECVASFIEQARKFFDMQKHLKKNQRECCDRILRLLPADLFGFQEANPEQAECEPVGKPEPHTTILSICWSSTPAILDRTSSLLKGSAKYAIMNVYYQTLHLPLKAYGFL